MKLITVLLHIKKFIHKHSKDHVTAFSAQAAFFIVLSFFPFLMFFLTLTQFLPFTQTNIINFLLDILPKDIHSSIVVIVNDMYTKTTGTVISLSIITALWSASKGILSITNGLNSVFDIDESRNYFIVRFMCMIYTFFLAVILVFVLAFLVFGNKLYSYICDIAPLLKNIATKVIDLRTLGSILLLILFFLMIYIVLPNQKASIKQQLPGALFSAISWTLLSYLFSFYIDNFSNFSYTYGSLTSIIVTLLWLYLCMNILFLGAEINFFLNDRVSISK